MKPLRPEKARIVREYMPYGSVLVVDDTETNRDAATLLMAPYGLKIETAESGAEAVGLIESGRVYDIVFMDHMMPRMDGIEAVGIMRGLGYKGPIVALTASDEAGLEDVFLGSGFDGFIAKPIDMRLLDVLLNKYIRGKQPPEALAAAARENGNDGV
jgi:CheY-like chemotaxis protein